MSLSDLQVRCFKATEKRQKQSCVDSLSLVMGRMRFPPGRKSSVVDVRIGVYGQGVGKWSLKKVRDEWNLLRVWSKEHNKDPRDRKKTRQKFMVQRWQDLLGLQ